MQRNACLSKVKLSDNNKCMHKCNDICNVMCTQID